MKKSNIILIGFMGVGKGTVARALVKKTNMFAIDTDDLIESQENKKIKKIFKKYGETYFRDLEKKCALWLEHNVDNTIISTGGGFYKQENLSKIGTVVYLKSSFNGIIKRLEDAPNSKAKFKKRPLLKDIQKAKELFDQRVVQYENVAHLIVDVENKDIDEVIQKIIEGTDENN
jgi:shikimate kinase